MTTKMRVAKIEIKNILGLESLEFSPGAVTVVEGENAAGKTSVLEALKAALSGGSDATLLRRGAEKGEVVLVLDDGVEIRKTVTAGKSDVTVTHPTFGRISKPQTYLSKIADALSVNPVEFLTASTKERLSLLLEAIPMKVTEDQIEEALPKAIWSIIDIDTLDVEAGHGLSVINAIAKEVFSTRTGVNRAAKEKRATISTMSDTLPPEAEGKDWASEFEQAKAAYLELQKSTQEAVEAVKAAAQGCIDALARDEGCVKEKLSRREAEAIEELKAQAQADIDNIRARLQQNMAVVSDDVNAERESLRRQYEKDLVEIQQRKDADLAVIQSEYNPKNEDLTGKLARAQEMMKTEERCKEARRFITQLQTEVEKLEKTSKELTVGLTKLESLKGSLLSSIPIEGLEITDGQIFLAGVPLDRVNTAKQVQLAIEVARLRAGTLGLVCVDSMEHLDSKTFAAFAKAAAKSDLQFVVTKVTDGPLTVGEAEVTE